MVMRMAAESSFTRLASLFCLYQKYISIQMSFCFSLCNATATLLIFKSGFMYFDIRKVIEETSQTVVKTCQPSASVGRQQRSLEMHLLQKLGKFNYSSQSTASMLCCVMRFSWATFAVEEEAKPAMPNQDRQLLLSKCFRFSPHNLSC